MELIELIADLIWVSLKFIFWITLAGCFLMAFCENQ